jgi:hypothetical protein
VRGAKVSEQFFKALVAVGPKVVVRLELAPLEVPPAVSADEAVGVELAGHGGDYVGADHVVAHVALVPEVDIFEHLSNKKKKEQK